MHYSDHPPGWSSRASITSEGSLRLRHTKVFTAEDCICRHQISRACIGFYGLRFSLTGPRLQSSAEAGVYTIMPSWFIACYAGLCCVPEQPIMDSRDGHESLRI